MTNGLKAWIPSRAVFDKYAFNWGAIRRVPQATLDNIPEMNR